MPTSRAPCDAKRPNIWNHAGSPTITASPGCTYTRAIRSIACVMPDTITIWSGDAPISSSSSRVCNCWRSGRKPCGVPNPSMTPPLCRPSPRPTPLLSAPSSQAPPPGQGPAEPFTDEEPGAAPRLQIALRDEPLVRLDDGEARHALVERELADRRHPHAGAEHAFLDAAARPLRKLVDERQRRRIVRRGNLVERDGHAGLQLY